MTINEILSKFIIGFPKESDFVFLKERENLITENSNYSFIYARYVIKSRFVEGEKAISENSVYSYAYALYVLNSRFVEGEESILNSHYKDHYKCVFKL
jgi:hypothetical protein